MSITATQIQELRQKTGASMMDCKRALEEANGNQEEAVNNLIQRGKSIAEKKGSRETNAGVVASYIHPNKKLGVLLELRCETDFVAQNADFLNLAHDLTMHIAAMAPKYVSPENIPQEAADEEKALCLLNQTFIKNPDQTIKELVTEYIAKIGENIIIPRFVRYEL